MTSITNINWTSTFKYPINSDPLRLYLCQLPIELSTAKCLVNYDILDLFLVNSLLYFQSPSV